MCGRGRRGGRVIAVGEHHPRRFSSSAAAHRPQFGIKATVGGGHHPHRHSVGAAVVVSTTFIIQYIFDKGFNQMQYGYASAISTVVMIIFALIAFAQFKVNNGGET